MMKKRRTWVVETTEGSRAWDTKPPSVVNGLMDIIESPLYWSSVQCMFASVISKEHSSSFNPIKVVGQVHWWKFCRKWKWRKKLYHLEGKISLSLINNNVYVFKWINLKHWRSYLSVRIFVAYCKMERLFNNWVKTGSSWPLVEIWNRIYLNYWPFPQKWECAKKDLHILFCPLRHQSFKIVTTSILGTSTEW